MSTKGENDVIQERYADAGRYDAQVETELNTVSDLQTAPGWWYHLGA